MAYRFGKNNVDQVLHCSLAYTELLKVVSARQLGSQRSTDSNNMTLTRAK